jgi:hypothetical protein
VNLANDKLSHDHQNGIDIQYIFLGILSNDTSFISTEIIQLGSDHPSPVNQAHFPVGSEFFANTYKDTELLQHV